MPSPPSAIIPSACVISVESSVSDAARRVISDGLDAFNKGKVGFWDGTPLAVLVRHSQTDELLGGVLGRTSLGLAFFDLVYLPQALRSAGLGRTIMETAEREAIRRGCLSGFLLTISFQAPEFYKRLGWQEFGRIECQPPGTSRVFLRKSFVASRH